MNFSVEYRVATGADVPRLLEDRRRSGAGAGDQRMVAYLEGRHHPQQGLMPRTLIVAESQGRIVGYIGGHRTRRFDCDGELQYLFVAGEFRRGGIGRELVRRLAHWFRDQGMQRVCVNIDVESAAATPFYSALGAHNIRPGWAVWDDIGALASG